MSSKPRGASISHGEVTNISAVGFWLLVNDREYFVPFADYPAFRQASVAQIYAVRQISPAQFNWPELDIDIELEALEQPDRFPLVFRRKRPAKGGQASRQRPPAAIPSPDR
jgi:hypothetical protein